MDLESAWLKCKPSGESAGAIPETPLTLAQPESSNVNARTVQLVKLLSELGPDIPEISRRLGQFKESVRYRYKEKIIGRGFAVQAVVDHERLGLRRIVAIMDFAEPFTRYAQSILASMNELCFLVSFAKTMPAGYYVAQFSVPEDFVQDLKIFLKTLKDRQLLTKMEILDFDWVRTAPMRAESYDFDTGRWDFDWSNRTPQDFGIAKFVPSAKSKYDSVDLLVIKELQMDANKSLKEISDKIKVNYKKLAWHYASHVLARRLIRGYSVNWMGTRYDYGIEKVLHRQHRYSGAQLIVREPSEYELMSLRQELNRLPFLWAESVGRNYAAFLTFPVDSVVEGLQYMTSAISKVKDKADIYFIDATDAASFTIPYSKFDTSMRKWIFDPVELAGRFEVLILEIKKGSD